MLTIVMYHFIRDLPRTRFPHIKGLLTREFRGQLDYMARFYRFVRVEDCLEALAGGPALPPNAALLTFDDGYAEHYAEVFPLLARRGLQGCFFPPVQAVTEHRVLDVNKIHFILAAAEGRGGSRWVTPLLEDVLALLEEHRVPCGLEPHTAYYARLAVPNRFDPAEVIFIKRLLQRELPAEVRKAITGRLFAKYVADDEAAFARELYVSADQLRAMRRAGMHIGSHGDAHVWLNAIPPEHQRAELDASLAFLEALGVPADTRTLCYPYGAYDAGLLDLVASRGFKLGFTTEVNLADLTPAARLRLPRLDTRDLPTCGASEPADWTRRVTDTRPLNAACESRAGQPAPSPAPGRSRL